MSLKSTHKILIGVIFGLAVFRVVLHFSENGLFEVVFFNLLLKYVFVILPVVFLLIQVNKKTLNKNILVDFLIAGIGHVIVFVLIVPDNLNAFDWEINLSRRESIVALAKQGKLERNYGSIYLIPDSLSLSPLKGKELAIEEKDDAIVTIKFYTDRGLLDHYQAFIYTNDSLTISQLDEEANSEGGPDHKIKENWYFICR
jgi:hypothetical protein